MTRNARYFYFRTHQNCESVCHNSLRKRGCSEIDSKLIQKNKVWVTDLIFEDYQTWENEFILMGCGTGRGKTVFSLDVYCPWLISQGKDNILYLCNRKKLKEQTGEVAKRRDIRKYVSVKSYHNIQDLLRTGDNIPYYDAIICDEAHYFLSDAEFNLYTDVSYNYIMRQTESVVLFLTATYKNIFTKIKKDLEKYCIENHKEYTEPKSFILPTDYGYVDKICWYQKQNDLYGIVDTIIRDNPDDKVIYFCNGIGKMQKFYNHYSPTYGKEEIEIYNEETNLKYMEFCCSEYSKNRWAKAHSNNAAVKPLNTGGFQFDCRALISTKCIDNGVDIKDRKLKHIICDIFDIESAIQCLGRKRILDEEDTCIFYIKDYQAYELNIYYKNVVEELESAELFIEDQKKWEDKFGSDRNHKDKTVFFDFKMPEPRVWKLNEMRYNKLIQDKAIIKDMIDKNTSYKQEILDYLGDTADGKSVDISEVENERIRDIIEIFIEQNLDQRMDKDKQTELVNMCGLKDRFGRSQKSIGQISKYLEDNYGYEVISKVCKIDGKSVRKWIIKKLDK